MANLNSSIIVQHIKGAQNLVADVVSRIDIGDSFMLNPMIFKAINEYLGPFEIDRFATSANT